MFFYGEQARNETSSAAFFFGGNAVEETPAEKAPQKRPLARFDNAAPNLGSSV